LPKKADFDNRLFLWQIIGARYWGMSFSAILAF